MAAECPHPDRDVDSCPWQITFRAMNARSPELEDRQYRCAECGQVEFLMAVARIDDER